MENLTLVLVLGVVSLVALAYVVMLFIANGQGYAIAVVLGVATITCLLQLPEVLLDTTVVAQESVTIITSESSTSETAIKSEESTIKTTVTNLLKDNKTKEEICGIMDITEEEFNNILG